ncbi:MAG: O-antigen ligase family protein [Oscillospiraceae bacterium]|nr:O-antigen ligase family protein [Oscillospiraceae bacterium]
MRENSRVRIKEKNHNDISFSLLFAMVWIDKIVLRYIRASIMHIPFMTENIDMLISLTYILLIILSMQSLYRGAYLTEITLFLGLCGLFRLHYYLFPLNQYYYEFHANQMVLQEVFPMVMIGAWVYRINREKTMSLVFPLSVITVYAFVAYMFIYQPLVGINLMAGDMDASYNILPHVCIAYAGSFMKKNPWYIGAATLGTVILVFLGTRGTLLCLFAFLVFTILVSGRLKHPIFFLFISIVVMVALFYFGILDFLYEVADENGFSLRIFNKIEEGEITNDTGRAPIRRRIWEYVLMRPTSGWGIYSDRRVAAGHYAHNILLELMMHYGIPIALIVFALLVYLFARAYFYLRQGNDVRGQHFLAAILFSACFKLFLSSSYLLEPYFYFAVGFCLAALMEIRANRRKQTVVKVGRSHSRLRSVQWRKA